MATRFATRLSLMAGVPLDPLYKHTLTFANYMAQRDYFESKNVYSPAAFNFMSYQRHNSGVIKVEAPMNILGTVNYLSFINQNYAGEGNLHEGKIFYAFITDIEYISDTVVAISYSIDVLQTWMFNYTVNPCYVEREHANSDNVGDNRVNEGLDTGSYVTAGIEKIDGWDSTYATEINDVIQNTTFVIVATQAPDGSQYSYQYNGVASSMYVTFAYNTTQLENVLDSFRNGITGDLSPIISIGMIPSFFKSNSSVPLNPVQNTLSSDQSIGFGGFMAYDPATTSTKTYTPKNNKLYCYPYNYMVFESPDGSNVILKFEDFKNNNVHKFITWCSILPEIQTMCMPMDYETPYSGSTTGQNVKYALCCKAYPYCAVASDAFSAWWAQNKYNYPIQAAIIDAADAYSASTQSKIVPANGERTGVLGFMDKIYNYTQKGMDIVRGVISGDTRWQLAGQAMDTIGNAVKNPASLISAPAEIASQNAAYEGHKAMPDTLATKANNGGVNHYMEWDCYKIYYTKIRPEYAEIIDNYFTCFGYATHVVKTPNITGRRNWNYVKTVGCTISGNIPSDVEQQITDIFDRGVTFWHNPATIHNYNANNDII